MTNDDSREGKTESGRKVEGRAGKCTWAACEAGGEVDQVGNDGSVWARLCRPHHDELEAAIASFDPKKLMRAYIKAQGGAKAAAARML